MKNLFVVLSLLIVVSSSLFAIGFGYHVLEVRSMPEFGEGVFPTSVLYQFNFPFPDLIPGSKSALAFRLDNGLEYRNLRQNPETGDLYAITGVDHITEYSVLFDEFNLIFSQGVVHSSFSSDDMLTFSFSIDGRFENAYERLSWMDGPDNTDRVFFKKNESGGWENRFSSFSGVPELVGDRSLFQTTMSFGFDFNLMKDEITRRNGIKLSSWVRWAPEWMPMTDKTGLYLLSWTNLKLSYTPFAIKQNDPRNLSWFSAVIDNSTTYRYIMGEKVPQYIQGGEIYGTISPNSEHVITNRLALTLYGPQINSRDCYLSVTGFWDIAYSFGNVLNKLESLKISELSGSVGFRASFMIFNVAELFYEIGYVYDPVFSEEKYSSQKFGFTIGV